MSADERVEPVTRGLVTVNPLGDAAIIARFGEAISRSVAQRARAGAESIDAAHIPGVTDVVPAFTTVAVYFEGGRERQRQVVERVTELCRELPERSRAPTRQIDIPVRYDGPDLSDVAARTGLSVTDVIDRHASTIYHAYMLGFVPGFAYLGDLDPALILPRRSSPRQRVAAGSVAIAGAQTAVYPLITPGGWHLIGTTDMVMFDASRDPPALLRAGDAVRFVPVLD